MARLSLPPVRAIHLLSCEVPRLTDQPPIPAKQSPILPFTTLPARAYPSAEPVRQSLDGGVRLAGGPPGRMVDPDEDMDTDSTGIVLPPSYQYYP